MKIKLNAASSPKITAALAAVNGKSVQHTYQKPDQLLALALCAEKMLEQLGIPLAERRGARYECLSGKQVASAYKWPRAATAVVLERGANRAWFITKIQADTVYATGGTERLHITGEQDQKAVSVLRKQYSICEQTARSQEQLKEV